MKQRKYCDLEDMIHYFLTLCCWDYSPTDSASPVAASNELFEDCVNRATLISNSSELKEMLGN